MSQWEVEASSWSLLSPERQCEFERLAGDLGAEWNGAGRVRVDAFAVASRLSLTARRRGIHVRLTPIG
jgi:hypothetical protein